MTSLQTKFKVGLFVILAFFFFVVTVIWMGVTGYLDKGRLYAIYFNESVQGLDRDAPVKYRGVTVGRVHRIQVAPDETLIEVLLQVDEDFQKAPDLVAELKSVGITGIMFIELDRRRFREIDLSPHLDFKPRLPVIATRPSDIRRLFESVEGLVGQLQNMRLDQLSEQLSDLLTTINHTVVGLELDQLSGDIRRLLRRAENVLELQPWQELVVTVGQMGTDFSRVTQNADVMLEGVHRAANQFHGLIQANETALNTALQELQLVMASGTQLMGHTDDRLQVLYQQLLITLENLEKASDHLNRFMAIIADQPSQIVFGEPMPERRKR